MRGVGCEVCYALCALCMVYANSVFMVLGALVNMVVGLYVYVKSHLLCTGLIWGGLPPLQRLSPTRVNWTNLAQSGRLI